MSLRPRPGGPRTEAGRSDRLSCLSRIRVPGAFETESGDRVRETEASCEEARALLAGRASPCVLATNAFETEAREDRGGTEARLQSSLPPA